tara:strand:+ start:376 stop:909 length:534 start_codon:yes stop_codon:yes gene_type:complete
MNVRDIKKVAAPLKRRIMLLINRGVLKGLVDSAKRQYIQLSGFAGETKDNVERVQEYGFTSHPHTGAQVIFISLAGNRDHPVAIAADDPRYRYKGLAPGEVAIYTDEGDVIHLKRGGTVLVKAATKVRIEGDLEVTGEIKDRCDTDGKTMKIMRTTYNGHTHDGDSGGTTSVTEDQM